MAFLTRNSHKSGKRFIGPSVAGSQGIPVESPCGLREIHSERLGMPMFESAIAPDASEHKAAEPHPDNGARGLAAPIAPAPMKELITGDNGAMGIRVLEGGMMRVVPPFLPMHVDVETLAAGDLSAYRPLAGYADISNRYSQHMLEIVFLNVPAFAILPEHTIEINNRRVRFGSPMKTGKYESIPVYVEDEAGHTRLVIAYRSGSQGCWRRFAGFAGGIYWKGKSEHLQNFDFRIQMKLDAIYDSTPAKAVFGPDDYALSLEDLGMSAERICGANNGIYATAAALICNTEHFLQDAMLRLPEPFDVHAAGNKPGRLIAFWWAGNAEDPYGRHVNLMVLSRNMKYIYCLALTDDGMFPKYIQNAAAYGINGAGAPELGVPIPEESLWMLTPIVEYDSQCDKVKREDAMEAEIHGTVVGGGRRVRILGVHENTKSPFFELNNGMSDYYRLLRSENFGLINAKLRRILEDGGELPQSPVPKTEPMVPRKYVNDRMQELLEAYHIYAAGGLDPGTREGQETIARLNITGRDIALFKRYLAYVESWRIANGGGEAPLFANQTLVRRLERVAERFTHDMEGDTIQDSAIISRSSA
ncbi:MAG: hypothetical protein V1861_00725 [Candidatus Micrarchaeota archaeon]